MNTNTSEVAHHYSGDQVQKIRPALEELGFVRKLNCSSADRGEIYQRDGINISVRVTECIIQEDVPSDIPGTTVIIEVPDAKYDKHDLPIRSEVEKKIADALDSAIPHIPHPEPLSPKGKVLKAVSYIPAILTCTGDHYAEFKEIAQQAGFNPTEEDAHIFLAEGTPQEDLELRITVGPKQRTFLEEESDAIVTEFRLVDKFDAYSPHLAERVILYIREQSGLKR